ncbi:CD1375 family protein [Exiguobacterium sp. s181]
MFTKENKVVQSYVLLIQEGEKTIDDVPDYQNLREVVSSVLAQAN